MAPSQRCHGECFQAGGHVLIVPRSNFLQPLVFGPSITRPLEMGLHNIDEANFGHQTFEVLKLLIFTAKLQSRFTAELDGFG